MGDASGLLLVGAVAAVGVLHTIVPDHWVPITLIARQRGWSKAETARVAFKAGVGHVLSTLTIALVIWLGGVAVAARFGHWADTIARLFFQAKRQQTQHDPAKKLVDRQKTLIPALKKLKGFSEKGSRPRHA